MMRSNDEGFVSRWSRRKQQVQFQGPEDPEMAEVDDEELQLPSVDEVDEAALAEEKLEKLNALTDEDMPSIESLGEESDYSGFMSTNVSEALRTLALQKLFHTPTYNVRDGLDEYDGDYTSFEKLDPSVITADMRHLLEVEAEKALAKSEEQELESQVEEEILETTSVDPDDSKDVNDNENTENENTENEETVKQAVAITDSSTEEIQTSIYANMNATKGAKNTESA